MGGGGSGKVGWGGGSRLGDLGWGGGGGHRLPLGVRVKVGFKDSVGVQIGQNFP